MAATLRDDRHPPARHHARPRYRALARRRDDCGHVSLDHHRDRPGRGKQSLPFSITILPLLDFVKGKTLPLGRVERFYSARIPVNGKDARTAFFALAGRIPPGLELNETTRRLEGTFLKAGTYRLRVYAFSATGAPISKLFTIRVRA